MPDRLLRDVDVAERLAIGRSTWWAWQRKGHGPAPVELPGRQVRWRESDVNDFIAGLSASSLLPNGDAQAVDNLGQTQT